MPRPQLKEFSRFFAGFKRIESRCRTDDFARGLEARNADALWAIARGWQVGELKGEDAGSVVHANVAHRTAPFVSAATARGPLHDSSIEAPLEMLVEREPVPWDWRLRVRVGQQFERTLRQEIPTDAQSVISAFRLAYPVGLPVGNALIEVDPETQRFIELMTGRVVDGRPLIESPVGDLEPTIPSGLSVASNVVKACLDSIRTWYANLYSQPDTNTSARAWIGNRLEYEFEATATGEDGHSITVEARSYRNGDLDWPAFAVKSRNEPDDEVPTIVEQTYRPVRVGFAGMPNRAWWAFEDHAVDFGKLDVAKPDLAKLALIEFALVYGDDWFIVPLEVKLGSVTKITDLTVTDVFGVTTPIPRAVSGSTDPLRRFEMFAPTEHGAETTGSGVLIVPPVLTHREESPPLEEVRFIRDEGANMVWAIEHRVRNGLGESVDGFDAQRARAARLRDAPLPPSDVEAPEAPAGPSAAPLKFLLSTTVPKNWIPFMPVNAETIASLSSPARKSIRLFRAQMLQNEAALAPTSVPSMTTILDPTGLSPLLWVDEQAVSRSGATVTLTRQRVRWTNGSTYVWLGRSVKTGKGEGRSGLRFDQVTRGTP